MVFDVYKFIGSYVKGVGTDRFDGVDHNNFVDNGFKVTNLTSADSPYTVLDSDRWINCNTSAGSITINLPAANNGASKPRKRLEIIKTHASNSLILDGNASETIDGSTTKTVTSIYDGWILASDGTNWIYPSMSGGGSGETNTASSVGTGAGWWKDKVGVDLRFKSFLAGSSKLTITSNADDLTADVSEAALTLSNLGGTLPATKGGTAQSTYTTGQMLYASASNTLAKLGIGTSGYVLTVAGGIPTWAAPSLTTYTVGANYLDFTEMSAPAAPSADTARLFALDRVGRTVMAYKNSLNRTLYLTGERTHALAVPWMVRPGGSSGSGLAALMPLAISVTAGAANQAADADGARKRFSTSATQDTDTGFSVDGIVTGNNNPRFEVKFKLASTADVRLWIGLFEGDPMAASTSPTNEKLSLRLASDVANANFCLVTSDGTTEQVVQLGTADTSIHTIYLEIDTPNSRIVYSWDGAAVVSNTSNLPAAATPLRLGVEMRNLTAADKTWDFWWLDGASDE